MIAQLTLAALSLLIFAALFVPLECAFPARPAQRLLRPALAVDACFFLGQYLLFAAISTSLVGFVEERLRSPGGGWPPARLIVALALGDFLVYWLHRACHRFAWLWRFHAVHHSAVELDWLAAFREHPLDGLVTQLIINLPAIALGVRPELLAVAAVFRGTWAIFVHSNVKLPLGPLRVLFGAPELHHWHHARLDRTDHNFANLAPWLDVIFGSYHCPTGEERYPLGLTEPWPRGYLRQLWRPFSRSAIR